MPKAKNKNKKEKNPKKILRTGTKSNLKFLKEKGNKIDKEIIELAANKNNASSDLRKKNSEVDLNIRDSESLIRKGEQEVAEEAQKNDRTFFNDAMPIVFSWTTVDFIKNPMTEFYYVIASLAAMGMIAKGIYEHNFLVVVTFIVMVILIIVALNQEPKSVRVRISESGIDLNGEHYSFNDFVSFQISRKDGVFALILKQRGSLVPFRTIYIVDQPINDLEMFLNIYLIKDEDGLNGEITEKSAEDKKEDNDKEEA